MAVAMIEPNSQACLSMKLEPCAGCYLWHPYAVCFVCFVIALPILGMTVGIVDKEDAHCNDNLEGIQLTEWLISFSTCLLCYEIYFFSSLPPYWSNMYARICSAKLRVAFYYIFTLALFLWWCTGWYIYAISEACQSTQIGAISLIVLLVSLVEAMVVSCFCLVTFMVRSYIRNEHPSTRRDSGRDTDPLLHRQRGAWISTTNTEAYGGDGTQSGVGMRGRIAAIIHEQDTIQQMQFQHAQNMKARREVQRRQLEELSANPLHPDTTFVENPPPPPTSPPNRAEVSIPISPAEVSIPISPADLRPNPTTPAEPRQNAADGGI